MRPRLFSTVLLLAACLLVAAGCGSSSGAGSGSSSKSGSDSGSSTVAHLGCSQYCQQAGGYGGAPGGRPVAQVVTHGTVVPRGGGLVVISVRCLVPVPCRGALTLMTTSTATSAQSLCRTSTDKFGYWAMSDLLIGPDASRKFGIVLTPCARHLLSVRRRMAAVVIADSGQVPACLKIPTLAPGCRRFTSSPSWGPDAGDGLIRVVFGRIVLASS